MGSFTIKSELSKTSLEIPLCSFPNTRAIFPLRFAFQISSVACSLALATQNSFCLSCSMQAFMFETLTIGNLKTAPAEVLYVVAVT